MSEKLKQYQESFLNFIHTPSSGESLLSSMKGTLNLASYQAMGVYRNDYYLRLTDVLGELYSSCWKVLGDEDFLAACELYINEHPSEYKSLSFYGESFPLFLEEKFGEDYPFIGELAVLEWKAMEFFHLKAEPMVAMNGLESQIGCQFQRKESAFFSGSFYDLHYLWNLKGSDEDLTWEGIQRESLNIVYKEGYRVVIERVAAPFRQFIDGIEAGKTLGQALEASAELEIPPEQWASFFKIFFQSYSKAE